MKNKTETLGKRLNRLRLERSLTTIEVAKAIGVSSSTYREWEYGRAIRGEPYEKLAIVFGVGLLELLTGNQHSSNEALEFVEELERNIQKLKIELRKPFKSF